MALVITSVGFRTIRFTDNGAPPSIVNPTYPEPVKFSAQRMAESQALPVTTYETVKGKIKEGPIRPVSKTPPPESA